MKNINKNIATTVAGFALVLSLFTGIGADKAFACSTNCNPPYPVPSGTCTANVSNPAIGDTVTWTVHAAGGNGFYGYVWTGTDGLSGTNFTNLTKSYSTSGTKIANVRITSNNQSVNVQCSVVVQAAPVNNNFDVSCYANPSTVDTGDQVTWTANASGSNGGYTYSWSGDVSGSSRTVYQSYSNSGTKNATVYVYSNGQTRTAQCSTYVRDDYNNDNLGGYCQGSSNGNNQIVWTAYGSGSNNGNYSYYWSGDASGSGRTVYQTYNNYNNGSITKYATVRITSNNGQSVTRTCNASLNNDNYNNGNLTAYCTSSPTNGQANQVVTWTAYPTGGNGNYTYSWTGDDGVFYGSNQSVYKSYPTTGTHVATVRVTSGGQQVSVNCATNTGTQAVGGIYLSSIPATGITPGMKTALFVSGLFIWSAFLAYLFIARRNEKIRHQAMLDSIEG